MNLGNVLKSYRLTAKLPLRELARRVGIDASALLRVERGQLPAKKPFVKLLVWLLDDTKK